MGESGRYHRPSARSLFYPFRLTRSVELAALEDLRPSASIRDIAADGLEAVVNVQWNGSDALAYSGLMRS